jgi:hypothetical protein
VRALHTNDSDSIEPIFLLGFGYDTVFVGIGNARSVSHSARATSGSFISSYAFRNDPNSTSDRENLNDDQGAPKVRMMFVGCFTPAS